jgi:hypothetical protein
MRCLIPGIELERNEVVGGLDAMMGCERRCD